MRHSPLNDMHLPMCQMAADAFQIGQIVVSTPLVGDLNGDQSIDRSDVALFASLFGRTTTSPFDAGDFDGDRQIALSDLALLQANLQSPSTSSPAAVPEPSTCLMLLTGALMFGLFGRRRQ